MKELGSRKKTTTLKEVAASCGVSPATVSRVLHRDSRISTETTQRVSQAIELLGYRPNPFARGLKTNRSRTIGFIVPEFTNDFFMKIARGVESCLQAEQYALVMCNANENAEDESRRLTLLLEQGVDGIIVIPASNKGAHLTQADQHAVPLVLVDRLVDDYSTDAILSDNVNGTYQGMESVLIKGHRRIGFIGGNMDLTSAQERYQGYTRALADYQVPLQQEMVFFGDFHQDTGYRGMEQLMGLVNPPESIFLSNVFMHMGAVKYLLSHRTELSRIPEIIGFDEFELSFGFCSTMIRQPIEEIGRLAAQTLLQRIHGNNDVPKRVQRLKTEIIHQELYS